MTGRKTAIIVHEYDGVYCGLRAHMSPRYDGDDDTFVVRPYFDKNPQPGLVVVYDSVESAERAVKRLRSRYYQSALAVAS